MPTSSSPGGRGRGGGPLQWLAAPAHWCALALGGTVLALKALGWLGSSGWLIAAFGYAAGFVVGGLWFGFPWQRAAGAEWEPLAFADHEDVREAMAPALHGVRRLTEHNPDRRIPAPLQSRVLALCQALEDLLQQWERSRGNLSLQDSFDARHIAIRYLPEALNSYLSIPPAYASTRLLDNGRTAQDTFSDTLQDLEAKVRQLADDLAAQDAQAFLVHSRFLKERFGAAGAAPVAAPVVLAGRADPR